MCDLSSVLVKMRAPASPNLSKGIDNIISPRDHFLSVSVGCFLWEEEQKIVGKM